MATATAPARAGARLARGVVNNARLTGLEGAVLFVLLAAEGVTILAIHELLTWHYLVGFVMLPPVAVKLGSTLYRFGRYYLGDPAYREAGPPAILLRVLGPVVVVTTVAVLGTGIELWAFGDRFGHWWTGAHKASFFIWFFAMAAHVLGHAVRASRLAWAGWAAGPPRDRLTLRAVVLGSVVLGIALAIALATYPSPFVLEPDRG